MKITGTVYILAASFLSFCAGRISNDFHLVHITKERHHKVKERPMGSMGAPFEDHPTKIKDLK